MARVFVLVIRTDDDGAIRRLRRSLKTMWRRDRLRCVAIEEKLEAGTPEQPANQCKGES